MESTVDTIILAPCWVCEGKPIARSCPVCLAVLPDKGICGHCKGERKMPLICPACSGIGIAPLPPRTQRERDRQGWRDPLICQSCYGRPDPGNGCHQCQNRGRIHIFYSECDILDDLRQCPCVTCGLIDSRKGAFPGCVICRGDGVVPFTLWAALDAYARVNIGSSPPVDMLFTRYRFLADHLCDIVRLIPAEEVA